MLFNLRSTRGRIGITVAISIVMIGLWFRFEMPIAYSLLCLPLFGSRCSHRNKGRPSLSAANV